MRIALIAALLIAGTAANAQAPTRSLFDMRGTPEDEKACARDARRHCRAYLADDMAVLRCFQANRQKISRGCQAVLRKYGQ